MVDDNDGDGFPSPEPRMDSKSALPMKIRAWRRLRIVKHDDFFSLIFSLRKQIYRVGVGVGGYPGGPRGRGARPRWGAPHPREKGVGPLVLHRPQLQLYIFTFGEKKNQREGFIAFTIRSRRQALNSLRRADLESVRGSGEGNPSPSSSSTILHHQFHDAHRRA